MNFSISPAKLPWDHYAVKSVQYFYVALKRDTNSVLIFFLSSEIVESFFIYIKGDSMIAVETGFVYIQRGSAHRSN